MLIWPQLTYRVHDTGVETTLRIRLDEISADATNAALHGNLVAELTGHSVRELSMSDPRRPSATHFNCFSFAFNLADSAAVQLITSRLSYLYPDEDFARHLIDRNSLLEIKQADLSLGDVVVYFAHNQPKHAGKVFGDRIVSKWGRGLLWEHALHEIPAVYGDTVRFFCQIDANSAEALFLGYVNARGFDLERWPAWREFRPKSA
jgi:hypothetical protein